MTNARTPDQPLNDLLFEAHRVHRAQNLKALAARERLSLSTVSRRLSALEDRLGVVLAERGPRRFALTDAGERYYSGLAPLLQELVALEASITQQGHFLDLSEHDIDIALRMGTLPDSTLLARRLGTLRHILVAAPAVVDEAGGPPISVRDLDRFPIIEYTQLRRPGIVEAAADTVTVRLQNRLRLIRPSRSNLRWRTADAQDISEFDRIS